MRARDLLVELGVEDMPPSCCLTAVEQLPGLLERLLRDCGLSFQEVVAWATPRRLVVRARRVAAHQAPRVKRVRGPAAKVAFDQDGRPTAAALGFARAQGVAVEDLVVEDTAGGQYVFAVLRQEGRPAVEVLPEVLTAMVAALEFPKMMRWGTHEVRFPRPVRWIVALWGDQVVPWEFAGVRSGAYTRGHRFLAPGPWLIPAAEEYAAVMESAKVLVDHNERKKVIAAQVQEAARQLGGVAVTAEELLDEVTFMVEWPTAFSAAIDAEFMELPREVLEVALRVAERCFAVQTPEGDRLLPAFVGVRDGGPEGLQRVAAGYRWVVRARLADAAFFIRKDCELSLQDRLPLLKGIVYHRGLGSVADKSRRVRRLSAILCELLHVPAEAARCADRAAELAKADLTTEMVREFPDLEGCIGREYALRGGESPDVAQAIFESRLPRWAGDIIPETTAGTVVALADRLDTLAGFFALGEQPTGSQDPFALRRHALGLLSILLGRQLRLDLAEVFHRALSLLPQEAFARGKEEVWRALVEFVKTRLRGLLLEEGLPGGVVDAVLPRPPLDPVGLRLRARHLDRFLRDPAAEDLLLAHRRAYNLSRRAGDWRVRPELLQARPEAELWKQLQLRRERAGRLLDREDYFGYWKEVAALRSAVDRFLDNVLVMAEDVALRRNRLALCRETAELLAGPVELHLLRRAD